MELPKILVPTVLVTKLSSKMLLKVEKTNWSPSVGGNPPLMSKNEKAPLSEM